MKNLIIFSTKCGASENCAKFIKKDLKGETDLINLGTEKCSDIDSYDNVIIGGGIYAGKLKSEIKDFVEENKESLKNKNIGLFILCREKGDRAQEYIKTNFPEEMVKKAFVKEHLGHGLNLDRLNFIEKLLFRIVFKVKESSSEINHDGIKRIVEKTNLGFNN